MYYKLATYLIYSFIFLQESLSINLTGINVFSFILLLLSICFTNKSIAVFPIASAFCFTVVNLGVKYCANSISSKPTIEISSGTLSPESLTASIAPISFFYI